MTTAVAIPDYIPSIAEADIEQAMTIGDLSKMPPAVRVRYYLAACESAGLNPLTQPFTPMKNQAGQVVLYPNATAAEQLRKRYRVSVRVLARETLDGLYTVTVAVSTPDGRYDESQGIVDVSGLRGVALANARMKAETKAKRRATLALCGLGYGTGEEAGPPVCFDAQTGVLSDTPLLSIVSSGEEAAADLFGEGSQPTHPDSPEMARPAVSAERQLQEAECQEKARLIAEITTWLFAGGIDTWECQEYWSQVCRLSEVERPSQVSIEQLKACFTRAQQDRAAEGAAFAHSAGENVQAPAEEEQARLIEAITTTVDGAGGNSQAYWGKVCQHFIIERPSQLTLEQLHGCYARVHEELAQRATTVLVAAEEAADGHRDGESDAA